MKPAFIAQRAERGNDSPAHRILECVGTRSVRDDDDYGHAFIWRASGGTFTFPVVVRDMRWQWVKIRAQTLE